MKGTTQSAAHTADFVSILEETPHTRAETARPAAGGRGGAGLWGDQVADAHADHAETAVPAGSRDGTEGPQTAAAGAGCSQEPCRFPGLLESAQAAPGARQTAISQHVTSLRGAAAIAVRAGELPRAGAARERAGLTDVAFPLKSMTAERRAALAVTGEIRSGTRLATLRVAGEELVALREPWAASERRWLEQGVRHVAGRGTRCVTCERLEGALTVREGLRLRCKRMGR